ncbi:MAG: hypothetical protein EBR82_11775 [Caulobacteraceae bacterium]|nr:hypothetical protein [Caulobacteraceae bacterium]
MARQSNVDKLKTYRGYLDYSKRWRQNENYDQMWQRLINLYRGRQYRGQATGDRLLVNISFSTINTLAPAVSIGRPKINVNPRKPDDAAKSIVTESIINYWWQHYGCQKEFQRAVKDYLILGHGWVKTGYRFIEESKVNDIEYTSDDLATGEPADDVEAETIIREDRPFLERVDPFEMFIDPDATCMEDARWIAQRTRRPLKDAKADKRYDAAARKDLSPSGYQKYGNQDLGYMSSQEAFSSNPDNAYCDIYEYYNIDTGEMSVFSDSGGDKFLIKPIKMPYAFGHPFFMLRNYDIPGFFYPMGELEAIEPLQYELNETRTQMMLHRKRYSRKWLFQESAFDDDGRQALASDEDNVIVPVKSGENLNNVVTPMPALINPPEFYNQSSLIQNDIDRVSGVSEYQRGAIPETTRTAREAAIIAEAGNARVAEKLVAIENGIAACASNLIMLAQQFMTGEQTVRIVGTDAAPVFLTFDKDYISGEFDFTVEAGSTAPRNEAFRRDMALQIVSAMQPFAQAGLVNLSKLAEYVLQQGFGVKDPGSFLQQAPPPEQPMPEAMPPGLGAGPVPAGLPPEIQPGLITEAAAPLQGPGSQPGQGALPGAIQSLPPEIIQALLGQQ